MNARVALWLLFVIIACISCVKVRVGPKKHAELGCEKNKNNTAAAGIRIYDDDDIRQYFAMTANSVLKSYRRSLSKVRSC